VRINPFSLMSLILLVLFTLIMALLTVAKSNQVRKYSEGDPENREFKTIPKLRDEVNALKTSIAASQDAIGLRTREIRRLDNQLAISRIHIEGDRAISAIALPPADELANNPVTTATVTKDTTWKFTSDRISASQRRLETLRGLLESKDFQDNPALDEAIRKRQGELQDVTRKISDDDAQFRRDQDDLTKRLDDLEASRVKIEKQQRDDSSRQATKIVQLEDKISQLLELETRWMKEIDEDGRILEVANNQVVISIGARDKVFPGLLFAVFTSHKGKPVGKGMIEAIEVRDGITVCRILRQDDSTKQPIGMDDQIGNPVFDSHRPKTFYVAGEFKTYNKSDIEQFIRNTGGVISPTLGANCDFLVAGDRSDAEKNQARQFQVLAMDEAGILSFVQRSFAPKQTAK
jgi:hypothetical protein